MSSPHSHYDNLFVTRNAPIEVIRASFKVLAQKYHPDKNTSPDAERVMKLINQAWEVLSDPHRRNEHDEFISRASNVGRPTSAGAGTPRKSQAQASQGSRTGSGANGMDQAKLMAELEPQVVHMWFKGSSQKSLLEFLRARGLGEPSAQVLVKKVVNWS